jgi:hypothetical protein
MTSRSGSSRPRRPDPKRLVEVPRGQFARARRAAAERRAVHRTLSDVLRFNATAARSAKRGLRRGSPGSVAGKIELSAGPWTSAEAARQESGRWGEEVAERQARIAAALVPAGLWARRFRRAQAGTQPDPPPSRGLEVSGVNRSRCGGAPRNAERPRRQRSSRELDQTRTRSNVLRCLPNWADRSSQGCSTESLGSSPVEDAASDRGVVARGVPTRTERRCTGAREPNGRALYISSSDGRSSSL